MRLGLAGPSNIPYSVSADSQRTVNLFPELIPGGRGKAPAVLYGTPGLTTRVELSTSNGIKALFYDTATRRIFAVKKRTNEVVRLSELTTTTDLADTETDRGLLLRADDGADMTPTSISSNGSELFIVCPEAKKAFVFTLATNTLTEVTGDVGETNPKWGVYLDGYFIALDENGKFYLSGINDGLTWDAIDVATPESSPDTATMLMAHRGFLWVFGSDSVEIWRNTGDVDFPFAPIKYQTIRTGLLFTYSVSMIGNSLFWVSRSASGPATIVEARGPEPQKISSNAVTASIQEKVVGGAAPVAWTHQHLGHSFYVLTFPDDNLTWAYDVELGKDMGWHERTYLNGATEEAHRGRCCSFVGGEDGAASAHLVGDRGNGKIYAMSMSAYSDAGDAIQRIRRAQHISDEMKQIVFHELELDIAARSGAAAYSLRWSDDGAKTFRDAVVVDVPADSDINPMWRNLGAGRDRVFEVSTEAEIKHVWLDSYLKLSSGEH